VNGKKRHGIKEATERVIALPYNGEYTHTHTHTYKMTTVKIDMTTLTARMQCLTTESARQRVVQRSVLPNCYTTDTRNGALRGALKNGNSGAVRYFAEETAVDNDVSTKEQRRRHDIGGNRDKRQRTRVMFNNTGVRQEAIDTKPRPPALVRALLLLDTIEPIVEMNGGDMSNGADIERALRTMSDANPDAAYFLGDFNATEALYILVSGDVRLETAEHVLLTLIRHRHLTVHDRYGGVRLLPAAAAIGSVPVVRYLIEEAGADVHVYDDGALREAAQHGKLDVVRYLIEEAGADVHVYDDGALRWAAQEGKLDVVRYLIEQADAYVHADTDGALRTAVWHGELDVVRYLIEEADADVHAYEDETLRWAARTGKLDVVRYLIEQADADVHAGDDGALRWAAWNGYLDVVRYLIEEARANVHARGDYALRSAVNGGKWDVARYLVEEAGADAGRLTDEQRRWAGLPNPNDKRQRTLLRRAYV